MRFLSCLLVALALTTTSARAAEKDDTFSPEEVLSAAGAFFGGVSEGLAKVIEKVFDEHGRPVAYLAGEEVSGAFGIGVQYGQGMLTRKAGGKRRVYWQGPSVGFDFGADASKTFVLIYGLKGDDSLFQRFPGVEGSYFFVAGVGVNYLRSGGVTLAPIRTGVGLRAGVNIGYMHVTREKSWIPF